MLHHDGNIGFDHARVVGIVRYGFRIGQFIETDMLCSQCIDNDMVRPGRFSVGEENRDMDVGIVIAAIKDAYRVMAHQWPAGACTSGRYITVSNDPASMPSGLVHLPFLLPTMIS